MLQARGTGMGFCLITPTMRYHVNYELIQTTAFVGYIICFIAS